jgi:fatty acid desaturase
MAGNANTDYEPPDDLVVTDYGPARRAVLRVLGGDAIARLHQPVALFDWGVIVTLPVVFLATAVLLATSSGYAWWAALIFQGLLIQTFGYVVHDLFIHRRVGARAGYYIAALFELPVTFRLTWHALYHIDHHRSMNTPFDPEAYKQDLDTVAKRLLFLTLPGALLVMSRRLKPRIAFSPEIPMGPLAGKRTSRQVRQLRFEQGLTLIWDAVLVAGLFFWWRLPVYGYLIPIILVTPVASGIRTLLEHAECDPRNVFHCATFYRTGFITRPLFFWDAGDCHIVHHIFPAIPFYRMPAALKALTPILKAHGARERRSFVKLLHGWFWRNEQHRTLWSH